MKKDILPPQAFTSDQVFEAYEWFQKNPDLQQYYKDIKPKDVVGLYLRYKRTQRLSKELKSDELNSTQMFKDDLKTIAEGFKKFEANSQSQKMESQSASSINVNLNLTPPNQQNYGVNENNYQVQQPTPQVQVTPSYPPQAAEPAPVNPFQENQNYGPQSFPPPAVQTPPPAPPKQLAAPQSDFTQRPEPPKKGPNHPSQLQGFVKLDKKSHAAVQSIQAALNLSSEDEALRTLIAAGFERMRTIVKVDDV